MTLTTRRLLFLLFLLLPALASAQTHPCDQAAPTGTVIQSGAPHKVAFCSPSTDNVQAVVIYVDGQAYDLIAIVPLTAPSGSGFILYETPPLVQVARGDHEVRAATYNRNQLTGQLQVGPQSAPFVFGAVDPTPLTAPPVLKGVSR